MGFQGRKSNEFHAYAIIRWTMAYDYLIKNATIIDGTGREPYAGDLAIKGDKIVLVGEIADSAKHVIDAQNSFVAPGFIDITNHSDTYWTLFSAPFQESMVAQGVTTIIGGNCGASLAPLASAEAIRSIQKWTPLPEVNVNWSTLGEFLNVVEDTGIGVNFGTLVGHSTLRRGIVGDEIRALSQEELSKMSYLLEQALNEGAFGISTGLVYAHGKYTSQDELAFLAKVASAKKRIYATHLRSEGRHVLSAVDEVIKVSEEGDVRAHISHFKVVGKRNWAQFSKALTLLNRARSRGVDITFDVYPYRSTGSLLYLFLPDWVLKGGKEEILMRLRDRDLRSKIIKQISENSLPYDRIFIADALRSREETAIGKSISELAIAFQKSPEETVIDLLVGHDLHVVTLQLGEISLKNLKLAATHRASVFSSDGAGYDASYEKRNILVHPRSFAAFPRVLKQFSHEKKWLLLKDAIAKMTSNTASLLGLTHRGRIDKGFFADLVVFNADTISDEASYSSPYHYPNGIDYVFINGELALRDGQLTKTRSGRVLRAV